MDSNTTNLIQLPGLDVLAQLLADKLCAIQVDIVSLAELIKLCCDALEQANHNDIPICVKHRLCRSLATCFFLLLEHDCESFPEILSYIRMSLTCMSSLKQSSVASHILCRALLERSLVYGHLFNKAFNKDSLLDGTFNDNQIWIQDDTISLSKENLRVTVGHRFRRLPNYTPQPPAKRRAKTRDVRDTNHDTSSTPDIQSINCYLLVEAFKSSINNIEDFATLFVEFQCPVMFDKNLWPSDESLRVINARNLSILQRFEQVPPFWDLYELIGQAGVLKNCLVLVKALLAAHLAIRAAATTNLSGDKTISTARLIPPMAESGLIPKAFGLAVEVFPSLSAGEVFSVLSDIWQYLKDTNSNGNAQPDKAYTNRLRVFMCHKVPGKLYVRIFKDSVANRE